MRKNQSHFSLVPFLKVLSDADPYCFTREGEIVIWRHEEPDDPKMIDLSFSEVVIHEITELDSRVERMIRERGV